MKWVACKAWGFEMPVLGKPVLLALEGDIGMGVPGAVVVGHLVQTAAGVRWVHPGVKIDGREVTHWCDCLPEGYEGPK